jgi:hypothetical protein
MNTAFASINGALEGARVRALNFFFHANPSAQIIVKVGHWMNN